MIPRESLRVVALIPYADEFIRPTVERAWWWADEVLVGEGHGILDFDADCFAQEEEPESPKAVQALWNYAEKKYDLTQRDYVAVIRSGEILVDWAALRPAIRRHFGKRVGAWRHVMWTNIHRMIGYGEKVWPFFPFLPEGRFSNDIYPNYWHSLDAVEHPVGNMLTFRYSTPDSRDFWKVPFPKPDPERGLEEWKQGGLI